MLRVMSAAKPFDFIYFKSIAIELFHDQKAIAKRHLCLSMPPFMSGRARKNNIKRDKFLLLGSIFLAFAGGEAPRKFSQPANVQQTNRS